MKQLIVPSTPRRALTTVAALALVAGLAGTALAAAPGDPWRLGVANAIDAATRLTGVFNGALVEITNTSADRRAVVLRLSSKSPNGATLVARNTGGGTNSFFSTRATA